MGRRRGRFHGPDRPGRTRRGGQRWTGGGGCRADKERQEKRFETVSFPAALFNNETIFGLKKRLGIILQFALMESVSGHLFYNLPLIFPSNHVYVAFY